MSTSGHVACIKDLLGPKSTAIGCRCPCPRCSPPPRDFKQRAANDREENYESDGEGEKKRADC